MKSKRIGELKTVANRKKVVYKGKEYESLEQLLKETGVGRSTLTYRMRKGMSLEEAIDTDRLDRSPKRVEYDGKEYSSFVELCEAYGVNINTFRKRRQDGCSVEEALKRVKTRGMDGLEW